MVERKPLKKQPPQVLQGLNVKLLANIIRAVNIPVRSNPIREPGMLVKTRIITTNHKKIKYTCSYK